jgi:hypothetical protein
MSVGAECLARELPADEHGAGGRLGADHMQWCGCIPVALFTVPDSDTVCAPCPAPAPLRTSVKSLKLPRAAVVQFLPLGAV